MAREGRFFTQPARWGESIAASLGGSSAALKPNDTIDWSVYAAHSSPDPFPYDYMVLAAEQLRNSSAKDPYALQQQIGTALAYNNQPDILGGFPPQPFHLPLSQPTTNTPYAYPNNQGYQPANYNAGSGRIADNNAVQAQQVVNLSDLNIPGAIIDHYKNAGQNIALGVLAIGLILLGGYAVLK